MKIQSGHFFSTLTPHAIAAQVSLGFLTTFHATLLVLWARGTLDNCLFSLQRIGFAAQLIALTTQVFSVLTFALLCFAIQAISSDQTVRRGACIGIAELPIRPVLGERGLAQVGARLRSAA